ALAALGRGGGGNRRDATPQVVAIASSLPAEGKSTSAIALARTLALTGTRTLLVDCDTRRASVRQMVRARAPGAGLLEVLRDKAALDDAIQPGDVAGLDHLLVARPSAAGGELLRNGRMEELLATLRARYDHVVLDLPPMVGLADGRLLAAMADATVLVIKWNSTPVPAAVSAVEWLRHDGGHPVGVLFTQVDPATRAAGGMHRYAKRYASYYPAD
uniref:CpsD/CapB family tyrosine-protein kinase n=1 Tax=uncultured Sphingomonas sp. TaxID=158754 RepID=UPI0025F816C5